VSKDREAIAAGFDDQMRPFASTAVSSGLLSPSGAPVSSPTKVTGAAVGLGVGAGDGVVAAAEGAKPAAPAR